MANESARIAPRIYAERFLNREQHPSDKTVAACVQRAREIGILLMDDRHNSITTVRRNIRDEETVLRAFEKIPETV